MYKLISLFEIIFIVVLSSTAFGTTYLDYDAFFELYTNPETVYNLTDKGSGLTDALIVRGYYSPSHWWEDVSFGYERGLNSPYPIIQTGGIYLALYALQDSEYWQAPLAINTNVGFFGLVDWGYYNIAVLPDASVIYDIAMVSVAPASVPDASVMLLLGSSLMGLAVFSRKPKRS